MNARSLLIGALLLVVGICPASAVEPCQADETINGCWERFRQAMAPDDKRAEDAATAAAAAEDKDVSEEPAGEDTGGSSLRSTTKNFVPLLALSALLGTGELSEDQGDLVFDLNFLLPGGMKETKNGQLQAVAKTQPVLAAGVRDALPEAQRDELAGTLGKAVSAGDDWSLNFSYNLQNERRGRDFELYRSRFEALVAPLVKDYSDASTGAGLEVAELANGVADCLTKGLVRERSEAAAAPTATSGGAAVPEPAEEDQASEVALTDEEENLIADAADNFTFAEIAAICGWDSARAISYRASVADSVAGFYTTLGAFRDLLTARGLDRFSDLVANQPQLHVTLSRNEREPLVGADVTAGKLTWELSFVNVNKAMREGGCGDRLQAGRATETSIAASCLESYSRYVTTNADAIEAGDRVSLALEYQSTEEWLVPLSTLLPDGHRADLRVASAEKRIAELGWSRNFVGPQGKPTRFDLVARYEDVTDDPARRDRLVATATFDLKVGGLDLPLGIVYANHGEYLGEVDEQLSAHLGIKVNLDAVGGK